MRFPSAGHPTSGGIILTTAAMPAGRPRDLLASLSRPVPGAGPGLLPLSPEGPTSLWLQGWLLLWLWAAAPSRPADGGPPLTRLHSATAPKCLQRERCQAKCLGAELSQSPPDSTLHSQRGPPRLVAVLRPSAAPHGPDCQDPTPTRRETRQREWAHVQPCRKRREIRLSIIQGCRANSSKFFSAI